MSSSPSHHSILALGLCSVMSMSAAFADEGSEDSGKPAVRRVHGDLSVMVLGSGGPMAVESGRASAGYIIFTDGKPRLLMDVGGGTYARLAESGTNIRNIDGILISHLHIDHMADLSAMVKTIYFHARQMKEPRPSTNPVRIWGPTENLTNAQTKQFPSSEDYVDALYNVANAEKPLGIERYMNTFASAIHGGKFAYDVKNLGINLTGATTEIMNTADGLKVTSIGVFHGPVPSVAFRIDYKGHSIVYTGDTNSKIPAGPLAGSNSPGLISLASNADLLIYDTAITDTKPDEYPYVDATNIGDTLFFQLHTTPTTMGQVAAQSNVKTLVLSHLTPVTEPALDEVKAAVRAQGFTGKIKVAKDLRVYNLGVDD